MMMRLLAFVLPTSARLLDLTHSCRRSFANPDAIDPTLVADLRYEI